MPLKTQTSPPFSKTNQKIAAIWKKDRRDLEKQPRLIRFMTICRGEIFPE